MNRYHYMEKYPFHRQPRVPGLAKGRLHSRDDIFPQIQGLESANPRRYSLDQLDQYCRQYNQQDSLKYHHSHKQQRHNHQQHRRQDNHDPVLVSMLLGSRYLHMHHKNKHQYVDIHYHPNYHRQTYRSKNPYKRHQPYPYSVSA